jgi:23S rRNA (uracil1939-C5)-methyltransferase
MSDPWRYRSTASLAIGWEAGFRPRARRGILEIHDCLISHPLVGRFADCVNEHLRAGRLPNYHGRVWLDCTVVGAPARPRLQVLIQGIEGLTLETHPELRDVAVALSKIEDVGSVAYRHRSGEAVALIGDLMDTVEIAGRPMYLPAGSFLQANLEMLPLVLERMRRVLAGHGYRRAADVYGGIGTFGLPLAWEVQHMTLVELDPLAVEAARWTAELWDVSNVEFVSRHAESAIAELPELDVAIVDPPRSGLGDVVTSVLASARVPLVLYVSCSPPSLARDLARLSSAYRVETLDLFDFYPQTYHVEALVVLRRC